jgi:hypothetical protein
MERQRLERILAAYSAGHASEHSGGPEDLNQTQVSALFLAHGVAVVASHGTTKKGRCTCGDPNCKRPGRHPRTPLEDATSEPEIAGPFWFKWPKAKVIIATGQHGIIAVTTRGPNSEQALASLVDDDEASPETIEFREGHRRTYLLRAPPNAIPNGRVTLAEGVVVHGRGSFIVVPRNVTRPGRSYKKLFNAEIAPAPNWLLRLLGLDPVAEQTSPEQAPPKTAEPPMIPDRTFPETLEFELLRIPLDGIDVPDGTPRCDEDKVRALVESYHLTDVRMPLAVRFVAERTRESDPVVRLLSDPHQLAALKRLGIECAYCLVIKGGDSDERLWKLAELIHQPEIKVLDRALAVMEWVRLIREKAGHVAHPRGGKQPHDRGFAAAERFLGISRRDLGRAALIAQLSPEAQDEIRRAKLDDVQRALLEIANEPTEKQQLEKIRELKERYSKPRQKRAANADTETGTRKKDRVVEDEPTSPEPAEEDEEEIVASPDTVPEETPDDKDQPSAPEHRVSDEEKLERVVILWDQFVAPEWEDASETVRLRFFEALGYSAVAANTAGKSPQ